MFEPGVRGVEVHWMRAAAILGSRSFWVMQMGMRTVAISGSKISGSWLEWKAEDMGVGGKDQFLDHILALGST